jgi:antitoxin VapB
MSLNLKSEQVVTLANEVALLAHETKTEAIRCALAERRERLIGASAPGRNLISFLEKQIWPFIPEEIRGKRVTPDEEDLILGYGPDGF